MTSIENAVNNLQVLCRAGNVDKLQAECFTPQAMICGEGAPGIASGEATIREVLGYVLEATPNLSISITQAQEITPSVVSTWLQWSCPSDEGPIEFRSLAVWKKVDETWKIVSDMYGLGRF
ncbi:MAG: nuclear transport factor 2 family protein [Oceanospirillales bacterium]|nr:nuclear transport factor 2 family protein [Oceanospirillales bacterium]MBR9888699.1 nuclear transport factor 2 family protein [Oceanospirillales bacterium]